MEARKVDEEIILHKDASIDAFINLACLYWQVTDYGFNSERNLPVKFVHLAGRRMYEVLDEAQNRFGVVDEIEFWRHYFNFTTLGDDDFLDQAIELVESGSSLVPYFYIYMQTQNSIYCKVSKISGICFVPFFGKKGTPKNFNKGCIPMFIGYRANIVKRLFGSFSTRKRTEIPKNIPDFTYLPQVQQLITEIESQLTTKNRYILSVVNKYRSNPDT